MTTLINKLDIAEDTETAEACEAGTQGGSNVPTFEGK